MSSAIGWGALAVVSATTVGGAVIAAKGQKDAARTSAQGATDAANISREGGREAREVLDPYTQSGIPALNRRNILMGLEGTPEERADAWGNVYNDPVLTEQSQRVTDAVDRGASAGGMKRSGNRLAALSDRLQNLKFDFGQRYLDRLDTSVNTGYGAAGATAGVAVNTANTAGSYTSDAARSTAGGQLGAAQSYGSGLADIGGLAFSRGGGSGGTPDYNPRGTYGD